MIVDLPAKRSSFIATVVAPEVSPQTTMYYL
jgi:hypothetical protein